MSLCRVLLRPACCRADEQLVYCDRAQTGPGLASRTLLQCTARRQTHPCVLLWVGSYSPVLAAGTGADERQAAVPFDSSEAVRHPPCSSGRWYSEAASARRGWAGGNLLRVLPAERMQRW